VGVKVGEEIFLGQSIGIYENNKMQIWAWAYRVCMLNPSIAAFIVFEITAFIRTDGYGYIDSASDPDKEYICFTYIYVYR